MSRGKAIVLGLALLTLVAVSIVVIAGGRGHGLMNQGADAARTCVCDQEGGCEPARDGTGRAEREDRQGLWSERPMDGTGYGAMRGARLGCGAGRGGCGI
jgi:hypothetical protein